MRFDVLMAGGSEVKGAEDDLPCKVDCVPQLRVAEAKSDQVLPELFDVSSVSC